MNIKYTKINNIDVNKYRSQNCVRRSKVINGGFDYIVYATDQDWPERVIKGN